VLFIFDLYKWFININAEIISYADDTAILFHDNTVNDLYTNGYYVIKKLKIGLVIHFWNKI